VGTNAQQISGIKTDKIGVVPLELDIEKVWKIFRSSILVVSVMALNGNFGFESLFWTTFHAAERSSGSGSTACKLQRSTPIHPGERGNKGRHFRGRLVGILFVG